MRLTALLIALGCTIGCDAIESASAPADWSETSFTDERGLQWRVAISRAQLDGAVTIQGWSGVTNTGQTELTLHRVQDCGASNPVDLRTAQGELLNMDPFIGEGNIDQISTDRCQAQVVRLPAGETLWVSSVLWDDVAEGDYELFGTFWNGNASALRFAI